MSTMGENVDADASGKSEVIYLRVPSSIKSILDTIAKDRLGERALSRLVNRILLHFTKLGPEEQGRVLGPDDFSASDTIASVHQSWAEHAFVKGHWEWACEEYLRLLEIFEKAQTHHRGAWKFAQFRLGYCWTEVALALIEAAVERRSEFSKTSDFVQVEGMFEDAHAALDMGLYFYTHYGDHEHNPSDAVVRYNMACIYSLMAEAEAKAVCKCSSIITVDRLVKGEHGRPEGWGDFEKHWNDKACAINKGKDARDKIDGWVGESLLILEELREELGRDPNSGYDFIFRLAKRDPDLAFLRLSSWDRFRSATELYQRSQGGAYQKILKKTKLFRSGRKD